MSKRSRNEEEEQGPHCPVCTYISTLGSLVCEICETMLPHQANAMAPLTPTDESSEEEEEMQTNDVAGNLIFAFGKHKGKKFSTVYDADSGYVDWVLKQDKLNDLMQKFKHYSEIRRRKDEGSTQQAQSPRTPQLSNVNGEEGVLTVGKYKGERFEDVLKKDPNYSEWVQREVLYIF